MCFLNVSFFIVGNTKYIYFIFRFQSFTIKEEFDGWDVANTPCGGSQAQTLLVGLAEFWASLYLECLACVIKDKRIFTLSVYYEKSKKV